MDESKVATLIDGIKDPNDKVRAAAWTEAGKYGAAAVRPLADVMTDDRLEVARAAKLGLWKIVRYVGRPDADSERRHVEAELCTLLETDRPDAVRREVLWMLSEIGGDDAVETIRNILDVLEDKGVREDARCAVQRIPGEFAVQTLEEGLSMAPDDFRLALAQSLRARGVELSEEEFPCQKLVPTKQTKVKPVDR